MTCVVLGEWFRLSIIQRACSHVVMDRSSLHSDVSLQFNTVAPTVYDVTGAAAKDVNQISKPCSNVLQ